MRSKYDGAENQYYQSRAKIQKRARTRRAPGEVHAQKSVYFEEFSQCPGFFSVTAPDAIAERIKLHNLFGKSL